MARGELLRRLFISKTKGDDQEFNAVAMQIIAEEEKKNNHLLAGDLLRIITESSGNNSFPAVADNLSRLPKDTERQTPLMDIRYPETTLHDIVLRRETEDSINETLSEYSRMELLRSHGMLPRNKFLFCGPPGCGKTMCAGVISRELGLPLLYARFDSIVSSYLGETAANIRKVFDYSKVGRWVVLFDEFDAIGKARDDPEEHGEIKRVVNSFLQLLDGFESSSIVIAATNHEQMLDTAIWRRFDDILFFPLPTIHEIRLLLSVKLRNFPHERFNLKEIAPVLRGMSHSDIELVCHDAIRRCILEGIPELNKDTLQMAVDRHRARMKIIQKATSKQAT